VPCRHKGAALILKVGSRWRWVVNFTPWPLYPGEITLLPTEWEAEWAPEAVLMFWRSKKSLAPTGIKTPDRPGRSLVVTPTTLSHEIRVLLAYYAALCGNCLPTFRDNVSVPSSRVKSRTPRNIPEERRYYQHRGGSLKSRLVRYPNCRSNTRVKQTSLNVTNKFQVHAETKIDTWTA
jgi:hypothetical protein